MHRVDTFIGLFLVAFAGHALSSSTEVEINYRLQPNRDLTAESVSNAVTTIRVVEDRGLVAKSGGRLSAQPLSIQLTTRQSVRFITGDLKPDRTFSVEMRFLNKTIHVAAPDGSQHLVPDKTPMQGLKVTATADADGGIRKGSVVVSGAEASLASALQPTMAAVLEQAASVQPLVLGPDRSVPQEIAMQIPIPGIAPMDLKMRVVNRLVSVDAGVAKVQQIYGMDFGTPAGVMKMTADGSGAGTMLYEVSTRTLLSSETSTLMKMTMEAADGVLEMQLDSKQSQTMRPSAGS